MSSPSRLPLIERIARSAPGQLAVVTSTRRLARVLSQEADSWHRAHGARVWETPSILPMQAFVAALYDRAQHDPRLTGVRAPLTQAQEAAVWQSVVSSSDVALASPARAAALAADAWSLAHQWDIAGRVRHYTQSDDVRLFAGWAAAFERRIDEIGAVDTARLPDALQRLIAAGQLAAPAEVVFVGFDALNPQQQALVNALQAAGSRCEPWVPSPAPRGTAWRAPTADPRDEAERMADWVAARLRDHPRSRIGIVVPDLAARRAALVHALDAVLEPSALLAPPDRSRAYSVSLGETLSDYPLIAAALRTLRLAIGELPFGEISAWLRSPHLALAESGTCERFDVELRRRSGRLVTLDQLFAVALDGDRGFASLRDTLHALRAWRTRVAGSARRASDWAALWVEALQAAGHPGDATLDSAEYQTLVRWRELMAEFAAIGRVEGALDAHDALRRLAQLASSTIFQPDGGDPPVQVLGVLETAGLTFDHCWVMGLTAESWPPSARPHPLLPIELQRAAQMPGSHPDIELTRARATLDRLTQCADEIVASHALRDGERVLAASPLIAAWPAWRTVPGAPRARDAFAAVALERIDDADAPALPPAALLVGGTSVLQDQAACPFRAFARHRLLAESLEEPHDGFDASERGQLVHYVLANFWQALPQRSRATLESLSSDERTRLLQQASDEALGRLRRRRAGSVSDAVMRLERDRLVRLMTQWLQFEMASRGDFDVIATEERRALSVGPLALRGRLDRVDRLPDGRTVVIDYKTGGSASARSWLGPRPDEPQLPLYLTASETEARAVAFARVTAADSRFIALAEEESLLPGAVSWQDEFQTWSALTEAWRRALAALADEFAKGRAAVVPKRGALTCRTCDLALLCRIAERSRDSAIAGSTDER